MPLKAIPRMGLGTVSDEPEVWADIIPKALNMGFRHIDSAQMYGNEVYVGEGVAKASVGRDEVFISTKTVHREPFNDPIKNIPSNPRKITQSIDKSLERLSLNYIDMFYVHWPAGVYEPETVLPQFQEAYFDGKIKHIGVANFTPSLLDEAHEILDVPISAHQVEYHPLLQQNELLEYAQEHDHWVVAYAPLARGKAFDHPTIQAISDDRGITPAQVCLAWLLSKDNGAVIPKSTNPVHLRENLAALDVDLEKQALKCIDNIQEHNRIIDPEYAAWN